jgi:hypothetical protein
MEDLSNIVDSRFNIRVPSQADVLCQWLYMFLFTIFEISCSLQEYMCLRVHLCSGCKVLVRDGIREFSECTVIDSYWRRTEVHRPPIRNRIFGLLIFHIEYVCPRQRRNSLLSVNKNLLRI